MLAGGEEYFQPPEPIDHDSLCRFAAWCKKLKALEKPGAKAIAALATEADEVSSEMHVKEVVAGTLLRCIKQYSGNKRFAYWCLLDRLSKEYKSTFAFLFELHLSDVGSDCIDWEDPKLAPKYESLLEHWDCVFDKKLVQTLWNVRRKERLWAASHPEEARRQRQDEEATWDREIDRSKEEEGLDDYGEPCLAYMQGKCSWGDKCPQLHPPGLEGTLPPECRLGDWRCPSCSMINRHFRRRCFSCYAEKPQYKKGTDFTKTPEVAAACKAESKFLEPLAAQFGYNFNDEKEAVKYWSDKLATPSQVAEYLQTRKMKYRSQIWPSVAASLKNNTSMMNNLVGQDAATSSHHDDGNSRRRDRPQQQPPSTTSANASNKPQKQVEISVSAASLTGTPLERLSSLSSAILEDGVHSQDFLKNLFMLSKTVGEVASATTNEDADVSLIFFEVCRMVHTAWLATGKKRPHAAIPFLGGVLRDLKKLTFMTQEHQETIKGLAESV